MVNTFLHSSLHMERILVLLCTTGLICGAPLLITSPPLPDTSIVVFPHILHSFTESNKLISLSSNTSTHSLVLNVTVNNFHHSISTDCLFYTGTVTNGSVESVLGWTTLSICDDEISGIVTVNDTRYTIEPMTSQDNAHQLDKISSQQAHCNTKVDGTAKRLKRHQTKVLEKTIELLVVVDDSLDEQQNLTTYILRIINTVSHIFKDSSIGGANHVNIALVKLLIGSDTKHDFNNPSVAKDQFCQWQWKERGSSRIHHDIAVLITRKSICESASCGVLGIANYKSICKPKTSCAVVRDTGLSTAFTLAHELGHSLGMYHDDDIHANCNTNGQFIMSSSFQESSNPHKWSTCSQTQLYDFLSSSESSCLDNEPLTTESPPPHSPPLIGQFYSLNEQCRLLFGENSIACNKTNCSILWCSAGKSCTSTQYSPPAGGSPCLLPNNTEGVCYHGNCRVYEEISHPIDGGWSEWSDWGHCSSTCGRSVQSRHRYCTSPLPQYGGKRCTGEKSEYKLCTNEECGHDYRNQRCTQLRKNLGASGFHGNGKDWIAVDPTSVAHYRLNSCHLYCKFKGDNPWFLMERDLPSGTTCVASSLIPGVCIERKCIQIGCDGRLGSPHYTDRCGVTCGDNSTCKTVTVKFTPTLGLERYQEVIRLPAGARNIEIDQDIQSQNLIAACSKGFELNGPTNRPFHTGMVHFAGSYWGYHHSYLHTNGPVNESVDIKVYVEEAQLLSIKYTAPTYWKTSNWSSCSVLCGNGTITRNVTCTNGNCDDNDKPLAVMPCVKESCDHYQWVTDDWTQCSVSCGGGNQKRQVKCQHINGKDYSEEYCEHLEKPQETRKCSTQKCCNDLIDGDACKMISKMELCSIYRKECCNTCN